MLVQVRDERLNSSNLTPKPSRASPPAELIVASLAILQKVSRKCIVVVPTTSWEPSTSYRLGRRGSQMPPMSRYSRAASINNEVKKWAESRGEDWNRRGKVQQKLHLETITITSIHKKKRNKLKGLTYTNLLSSFSLWIFSMISLSPPVTLETHLYNFDSTCTRQSYNMSTMVHPEKNGVLPIVLLSAKNELLTSKLFRTTCQDDFSCATSGPGRHKWVLKALKKMLSYHFNFFFAWDYPSSRVKIGVFHQTHHLRLRNRNDVYEPIFASTTDMIHKKLYHEGDSRLWQGEQLSLK